MDIIDYRNVEVRQEDMFVLGDVTFTVQEGDFVYLIGKVGAGKSSLLRTMYKDLDILEGDEALALALGDARRPPPRA